MLSDAPPMKYKREEPDQGKRSKALTDEQKLEAVNAKGTTYQVGKHDGFSIYHTEKWLIDPLKQDKRSFPERPELMMVLIWVSRLWGYLSKNAAALSDTSGVQRGLSNESLNLNVKKNLLVAGIQPRNAPNVNRKTLMPQEHHGLERLELAKGQNAAQQHTASTFMFCPERSTADLWYWEVLHQKKDESPIGGSGFSMRKSGVASRTEDELCYGEPRSRLPVALGTDNGKVPEIMKRRGISRETDRMDARNKKAKLMVAEHEQRRRVDSSTQGSHASTMDEADYSTDILTDVHFMARNKAMSMHFMKCDPEGTAYVTFADRETIEGATSLPGTSFSSRFFTATKKGESPLPASCLCN
ncbi:uncharacterized protein [Aegilops tauschii subsp. strangulata]|uniref:uncharacterized protein isoform X2 n=1 Tax=Aegilops tauschii subsp. strangulata TaxID=200361 RepID=UPI001ABCA8A8|nr:uncharacterized protein LOC109741995 isoform X2 [Aegilops tauschii subsp. strangulata]